MAKSSNENKKKTPKAEKEEVVSFDTEEMIKEKEEPKEKPVAKKASAKKEAK